MIAKLASLLIVGLLGIGQVATQATPQLELLLDLNGDETVNVADVVLIAGFVASGQVRDGWGCFFCGLKRGRERECVCMYVCITAIAVG